MLVIVILGMANIAGKVTWSTKKGLGYSKLIFPLNYLISSGAEQKGVDIVKFEQSKAGSLIRW